jgi:hypothetical protein
MTDTKHFVTIQPATATGGPRPYPYHVQPDGRIARQDFWRGTPAQLAGFQRNLRRNQVDLLCDAFLADPEQAIGMFPVFVNADGGMDTLKAPVESVRKECD